MDVPAGGIWVFDTSSLINVKELIEPSRRQDVLNALAGLCDQGRVVFPKEVVDELDNGAKHGKPDLPLSWAKENRGLACRLGPCYQELATVMNDPVARLTPDPDQTKGADDADPHVLATALKVASLESSPVVVTQESRKALPQVPLNVAAGSLGLPSVNLYAVLVRTGIWTEDMKNR